MRNSSWRKSVQRALGIGGSNAARSEGQRRLSFAPHLEELEWRFAPAAPVALSIDRATPALPNTSAASVVYAVAFDQSVTGVDAADFKVTTNGTLTATTPVVVVAGSGASYAVTINGIRGSGDLRLDLIDDDSIVGAGLALGGPGASNGSFQGQSYAILQTFPSDTFVVSIDRTMPATLPANASSVRFAVTLSEAVTGVDPADFQLVKTGTIAATLLQVTPVSASVYLVTISGITGVGTLGLKLADDGSIRNLIGNPLTTANARAAFAPPVAFAAGTGTVMAAIGDVNGDGRPDLVVANGSSNTVGVLLGNGNGTFQAQQTFATGTSPTSVTLGDVNGDARPDLAIANGGNNTVGVLLGNGNGTFQAQQTFATGRYPTSVTLGDVNGDGKSDLAVANVSSYTVGVLLGNGNGTFQAQRIFATRSYPNSVTLGDVNGDGKPDLAVANGGNNTVGVLLGNGNGTFQGQQTFATSSYPNSVTLGDVNGDGKSDLAVANRGNNTVGVLLGNGNGTFQAQQTFATGRYPIKMTLGDVNGDGKPDLAVVHYNGPLGVLLGNGNGTFQAQQAFATGIYPNSVTLGDVNADGKLDFAVVNSGNTVSVLLGNGNGNFTGQTYATQQLIPFAVSMNRTTPAGPTTNAITVAFTVTFNQSVTGVDAADFKVTTNGTLTATTPVVVVAESGASYAVTINGIRGSGDLRLDLIDDDSIIGGGVALGGPGASNGSFQGQSYAVLQTFPAVVSINRTVPATSSTNATSVRFAVTFSKAVTDVDAADFQIVKTGTVAMTLMQVTPVSTSIYTVAISGITGDGALGLNLVDNGTIRDAASNPLTRQNAAAAFASQATFATGYGSGSATLGDVNGDGKADLAFVNGDSNSVSVLLGNGNGTFQARQNFATYSPNSLTMGDVNGDGKPDLVVGNGGDSDTVSVLLGNGNGRFQAQQTFAAGLRPHSVTLGDVNGDGKADLAVTNPGSGTVSVLLGNGNGTFQARQTFATDKYPGSLTMGDVNGDGKPDLVVTGSATVSVLLGNGNGTFQARQTFDTGYGSGSLTMGDVNGDGKPDLAVGNGGYSYSASVLLGNGDGTFQAQQTFRTGGGAVTLGDVNGDGKPDLAANGSVLLGNGNGTFQARQAFAAGFSGSSTMGDVNGDGKLDLVGANFVLLNVLTGNLTGETYTIAIDQTFPFLVSLNRTTPAGPTTNASTVAFTATFSESVTGVDAADFALAVSGVTTNPPSVSGSGASYTVTVSGIAGAGTLGLNLVDNGTIRDLGGNPLTKQNAAAAFASQATFATGPYPGSLMLADVNGDGKPDLFVGNSVLLGNGNGTFRARQTFAAGPTAGTLTLGDVNGDGKADLAGANYGGDSVSVLLGNGNGTFQAQHTFAAGYRPVSVTLGDVNGDSKADLVVATNDGNSVSVLLGNGNGAFQEWQAFDAGDWPHSLTMGDLNGDGKLDLVVANFNFNSPAVSVLLGNGNGTFQARQTFATLTFPGSDGLGPGSLTLGDVNGDGKPDLAVTHIDRDDNPPSVSVLLGNGNGTFQKQHTFAAGPHPGAVTLGDVNGDGKADLAVVNLRNKSVSVLLGNGNGTFQARKAFATGSYPGSLTLGDVNGDGKPDLAVANNNSSGTVSVFLNALTGNLTGPTYTIDQTFPFVVSINRTTPTEQITNERTVVFTATFSESVTGVDATDFALALSGVTANPLSVSGSGASYTVTVSGIAGAGTLGLNLVDNGAIRDAANNPLTRQNAAAAFATQATLITGNRPNSVTLGDVNGDGKADLAVANAGSDSVSVLLGNGNGTFQKQQTFATGSYPVSLTLGDVNGDGKADLAIANAGSDSVGVLLGNGNGTFQAQQTFAAGYNPVSVTLGDVNGDSKADLVVATNDGNSVSVLLGNGTGAFQERQAFAAGNWPSSLTMGDLNEDGKLDLVVVNSNSATVSVLLGNGNGTFQARQTFATVTYPDSLTLGDVNGDGKPDLAVASDDRHDIDNLPVGVLLGNGNGTFQAQQTFAAGRNPLSVTLADVNGDGKPDLAVADSRSKSVSVLLGNGNGAFQARKAFATGSYPSSLTFGDVNGDGKPDLAVASGPSDKVSVLLNALNGNLTGESYTIIASIPTTTTLTATPNASTGGMLVTFTATVAPSPANLGTVTFKDNGSAIDGATTIAVVGGEATFQVSTLTGGTHPITADYSGAAGYLPSTSNTLNFVVTAPRLLSITPNAGLPAFDGAQRSRVVNLTVVFDQAVQLDANAMTLALHTNNVSSGGAPMPTGMGALPTLTVIPSTDLKTWTITFSGPNVETGAVDLLSSLKDGVYDLDIDAAKVHPNGMPAVNMVGDSTTTFHCLFGDTNAPTSLNDGAPGFNFAAVVNSGDNLAFRGAFNNAATYKSFLDFNGDKTINTTDNLQFRSRFNKSLSWRV